MPNKYSTLFLHNTGEALEYSIIDIILIDIIITGK